MFTPLMIFMLAFAWQGTDPVPQPAAAAAAQAQPAPTDSPLMAKAKANKPLVRVKPMLVSRSEPDYPLAEKAAGNGGWVVIHGIITEDGRVAEATVARTNADPALTASALTYVTAARFAPAEDESGKPLAIEVTMPVEFESAGISANTVKSVIPPYDDAARAAGAHGKVVVLGSIGADGRLQDAKVLKSSHSQVLDDAALTAANAQLYRPFTDDAGKPVTVPLQVPFEFVNYRSPGKGGGILRYGCKQFAADETWWRANWAASEKDDFYNSMVGVGVLAGMRHGNFDVAAYTKDFDRRWTAAIDACAADPNALFIDKFKPEGDYARKLAQ